MAIKDYWVFQKRDTPKPWALLVYKEYDKRTGSRATCLDITYYHEDIQNSLHAVSEVCVHYDTIAEYAKHVTDRLAEYAYVTMDDERQIERELADILI